MARVYSARMPRRTLRSAWVIACGFMTCLCSASAWAQYEVEQDQRVWLRALLDVRLVRSGPEPSWTDTGPGKLRYGGKATASGFERTTRLALSQLAIEVGATLPWDIRAQAQINFEHDLADNDEPWLVEAILRKEFGTARAGYGLQTGIMNVPFSLEHTGPAWLPEYTLTASALNSWIGEEVKVIGAEATFERALGGHELSATAAVFGWNDTSGTLLTFRGWALHGIKTSLDTGFELPPLSAFMVTKQSRETDPLLELDHRAGYYGRLEWRPPAPVSVNALYYDNVGDRIAVDGEKQWAWETRFLNLGVRWDVDERTKVLAQAMNGETLMGYRMSGGHWVDMGFHAAYLLAARRYGEHALSGRVDWFEANDRTYRVVDNNDEEGWAVTGAWRHRLAPWADVITEVQHVSSKRPSRALAREAAKQDQTVLQAALRLSF